MPAYRSPSTWTPDTADSAAGCSVVYEPKPGMRVLVLSVFGILVFFAAYWLLMGPPFVLGRFWPDIWLFFTGGHQRPSRDNFPPVWLALLLAASLSVVLTASLYRVSARLRARRPAAD